MLALVQRVSSASVVVEEARVGSIDAGMLVFLGVEREDTGSRADAMVERLLAYRLFADDAGRMNLDVRQSGGDVLVISQFTLAADTRRGLRPSFTPAAPPDLAESLYQRCVDGLRQRHTRIETGEFGAHMTVSLVNDGPVTFLLNT